MLHDTWTKKRDQRYGSKVMVVSFICSLISIVNSLLLLSTVTTTRLALALACCCSVTTIVKKVTTHLMASSRWWCSERRIGGGPSRTPRGCSCRGCRSWEFGRFAAKGWLSRHSRAQLTARSPRNLKDVQSKRLENFGVSERSRSSLVVISSYWLVFMYNF